MINITEMSTGREGGMGSSPTVFNKKSIVSRWFTGPNGR